MWGTAVLPLILEVVVPAGGKVEGGDPAGEASVILQAAVRRPKRSISFGKVLQSALL